MSIRKMVFLAPTPSKLPLLLTSLQREQYQLGEAGSDLSCMVCPKALLVFYLLKFNARNPDSHVTYTARRSINAECRAAGVVA